MKEEWLFPNAFVPVDVETTAALVAEIKRLIGVVGGMALAQPDNTSKLYEELRFIIDGGSESFTHEDAVQYLKDVLAQTVQPWSPEDTAHRPGGLAQPEHPAQMARLGWQYVECPACGSEGARAFPKPEQEPVAFVTKEQLLQEWLPRLWDALKDVRHNENASAEESIYELYVEMKQQTIAEKIDTMSEITLEDKLSVMASDLLSAQKRVSELELIICQRAFEAQPEQEPVAWGFQNSAITGSNRWMMLLEDIPANDQYGGALWTPLYTTPPQRTWVGLTDADWEEISDMPDSFDQGVVWAVRKLKEKTHE